MAKDRPLLEEKKTLSAADIQLKIKRLQGYISRTERQIQVHEKALARLREKMRKEMQRSLGSIIRGKIYG